MHAYPRKSNAASEYYPISLRTPPPIAPSGGVSYKGFLKWNSTDPIGCRARFRLEPADRERHQHRSLLD